MGKIITKSMYGNVALLKGYCNNCKNEAFIIDGEFSCCGTNPHEQFNKQRIKREIEGENVRTRISSKIKIKILEQQNNKCIYCEKELDGYVWDNKRSKYRKIVIHFDHFISWNYSRDNKENNLYASCNICNQIKSDKHFYNLISAKEYINEKRKEKGYL